MRRVNEMTTRVQKNAKHDKEPKSNKYKKTVTSETEGLSAEDVKSDPDQTIKADWLVMVYLAGDNNLAEECVFALTEMNHVGSVAGKMEVMVHLDTSVHENTLMRISKSDKPGETNRRLNRIRMERFKRTQSIGKTEEPSDAEDDDERLGVIYSFVEKCVAKVEAKHHMLILSGHGNGTADTFLREEDPGAEAGLTVVTMAKQIERINKR